MVEGDMENLKLLSKRDAICLLEIIHESLSCTNEGELEQLINKLKYIVDHKFALCGFGKIANGCLTNDYSIFNINYPSEWLELYIRKDFARIDPIVKENCENFKLQYWSDTYKKYNYPKEFISHAEDHGLRNGYTYGLRNFKGNEGSLFSIAGTSIERHQRTEIILRYFVPHLHQALTRISGCHRKKQNVAFSQREKEVLKWIKEGKSTWDISVILGISENTVKYHVKSILKNFDAVSRTHAVAIAAEQGLIEID